MKASLGAFSVRFLKLIFESVFFAVYPPILAVLKPWLTLSPGMLKTDFFTLVDV